ncbi:MAG: zinc-finger domain-containing protein [Rhodospirillales bacterium]|nr:zinc-finger domain-containing protein [Rhodospirillales bacterium]
MPDSLSPPAAAPGARAPTEIIHVDHAVVACDGGAGPLGHPRVFLRIVGRQVMCPYCSRLYVLNEGAGHDAAH